MPTNTYVALQTQTLGTAAASVTFSSIPQGYTDLVLVSQFTGSAVNNQINIQVGNGSVDTGSNYSYTQMYGTGSAAASAQSASQTSILLGYTDTATTSIDSNLIANIQNYSNTTTNKTILSRGNSPARATAAIVGLWRSTAAINTITVSTGSSTFAVGSTFTIYGIAASPGAKATGGYITSDSQYYYHTFFSNGTFTPTQALTCDYLVVAGGGGGGAADAGSTNYGGGGGAGGLRSTVTATGGGGSIESAIGVTSGTNYTITVGAGGTATAAAWTNGSSSTFSTITATGGGAGGGLNSVPNWIASLTGGSGGGGDEANTSGAAGTANQGYAGGTSPGGPSGNSGGGGGGAGAIGANGTTNNGGAGGAGVSISAFATPTGTGVSNFYAGGGGASGSSAGGAGGSGGGGAGSTGTATAGTANTGGGGGSGSRSGAAGGSGVVIVRYAK